MTNEIKLAFSHPVERSRSNFSDVELDRISLRDHIVEVEIGAFQSERGTTQRICFNVVVEVKPVHQVIDDDVDKILSYDKVTEAISDEVFAERVNLLETLAERIADRVLNEPQAHRVFVRIEKLDRGPGALGVEIVRTEKDYNSTTRSAANGDEISIRPHVIYLSNAAINSIYLDAWINQLSAKTQPVVLCVGVPETSFEAKNQKPAILRRLDLLSIEQNAWILAGKNSKCVVVSTKTELDYAIKQGQISVWAPSKIILDANEPPDVDADHAYQLAYWLMNYLNGEKLSVIGVEPILNNKNRLAVILPLKENIF